MATTSPARIDDDLYASAKLAGEVQSRSASQQIAHWARIGREIEASGAVTPREIVEVLAGSRPYDGLSAKEQAVVRAEWTARMDVTRQSLNLAEEFAATGRTWVELDDKGHVVERRPRSRSAGTSKKRQPAKRAAATRSKANTTRARGRSAG